MSGPAKTRKGIGVDSEGEGEVGVIFGLMSKLKEMVTAAISVMDEEKLKKRSTR